MMLLRQPAVAGLFYAADPAELQSQVDGLLTPPAAKARAVAAVCPHAGLMYSGPVAGRVYSRILLPETVILVGPNHSGIGPFISVFPEGEWEMPLGRVAVESALADRILRECPLAEPDPIAHRAEHCLEVQLPFLQALRQGIKIVPIVLSVDDLAVCRQLGAAISAAVRNFPEPVLTIASTDMSHYEAEEVARRRDRGAIERVLAMDPEGLYETVQRHRITMCGYAPTVTVLFAAKALGAEAAELVHYATSAEVSGDRSSVVGYAGFIIK